MSGICDRMTEDRGQRTDLTSASAGISSFHPSSVLCLPSSLFTYTLRLADNGLILGHRLSEWCGHAPVLEEDLALANMALDLIGQARAFYAYAAEVEGKGRDEDALAYRRDVAEFRNVLLVERPNGDFAVTIVRQLFYAAFAHPYFEALARSTDPMLGAIAAKAVKEIAYHLRHASEWTIRIGDGTPESHTRAQEAVDELWPFTGELFEADDVERALIATGVAADPSAMLAVWTHTIGQVLAEATLARPRPSWMQTGGRAGRHSEHLGHILAELQFLQRAYPDARW
jgi:ring-1,2-phenylacetyl-CoA epoxidase subunit PaaC